LIIADPDFRANPRRAIFVQGEIDRQLVHKLAPRIVALQAESRDPITVYIDSNGGDVAAAEQILRLLTSSNQDADRACRIVTVVTNLAASAGADLLSSGDYAMALPYATIFYHGVRSPLPYPITVEFGSELTERLKIANSQSAMLLARKTEARFMFRFVTLKNKFGSVRAELSQPTLTDLECFLRLISDQLTKQAQDLLNRARKRYTRYSDLLEQLMAAVKGVTEGIDQRRAEMEAAVLKKIIDREVSNHETDKDWNFSDGGLARVNDDFFLLNEYIVCFQGEQFRKLCERWGRFVLTKEETAEIDAIAEADTRATAFLENVRPKFMPVWSFLVALCQTLQQGEQNYLTALDAYWLGLIDEIVGSSLESLRLVVEYEPSEVEPGQTPA
jgi:ATP-dependent protease ClpP protease subunit